MIRIPETVLSRELDGEAVLLDLRSGRYFGLNGTGARIWALLSDGLDRDAVADALAAEFDVTPERAADDVAAFVAALTERGLLERIEVPTA